MSDTTPTVRHRVLAQLDDWPCGYDPDALTTALHPDGGPYTPDLTIAAAGTAPAALHALRRALDAPLGVENMHDLTMVASALQDTARALADAANALDTALARHAPHAVTLDDRDPHTVVEVMREQLHAARVLTGRAEGAFRDVAAQGGSFPSSAAAYRA